MIKIHIFKVYNSFIFTIVTRLYNHDHYLTLEHFLHPPQKKYPLAVTLSPSHVTNTNLPFVYMDLPTIGASYK